jgi:hypothetical protein
MPADDLAAPDAVGIVQHDVEGLDPGWAARKASASATVEPEGLGRSVMAVSPEKLCQDFVEGWRSGGRSAASSWPG